ncbi:MAG TPA: hypothetical protein VHR66_04585 [Gemmataceae bacterium]|jgi:hypothetical protein|nr:hypothetical protein [Gemmataceae bacterium]
MQPTIDDLRRVHQLAAEQFPHEYLDVGLGAIGLFLHDSPRKAGYRQTPLNSITFASIGVDGIHFGSITDGNNVAPESPIVLTIPMAFAHPNVIVGESLYDFLCFGCRHGYSDLGNLHLNLEATLDHYTNPPTDFYDDRAPGILQLLSDQLSLRPWRDVREHFADLQSRFLLTLRMASASGEHDVN